MVMIFLKVAHITVAAVWLGHKVLIPADLRAASEAGGEVVRAAVARVDRASRVGQATGLLTFLTGLALIPAGGGFGVVPLRIYIGAAVVIVMFIIGATVARPAWLHAKRSLDIDDAAGARQGVRGLNTALLLEGVLWVVVLITMVS